MPVLKRVDGNESGDSCGASPQKASAGMDVSLFWDSSFLTFFYSNQLFKNSLWSPSK
ncbi:hypothetical protein QOZ98_000356 [Planomicrobium stackebrandtii]|uniref:Uncharacterized protein n=1 Tax=Planomicrobium stackebrandtii TaxID=253160 RepID=A0ABU0GQA3_9BACL|nr:hypothetical protein [Planomicrobium stackebrandtii]